MKSIYRATILGLAITLAALADADCQAQQLAGVWRGNWASTPSGNRSREHKGSLRVRLLPQPDGSYKGRFAGRFAVVIPYFYRADVTTDGQSLVATKRLGPMGEYTMRLGVSGDRMLGGWSAGKEKGTISLRRRPSLLGR